MKTSERLDYATRDDLANLLAERLSNTQRLGLVAIFAGDPATAHPLFVYSNKSRLEAAKADAERRLQFGDRFEAISLEEFDTFDLRPYYGYLLVGLAALDTLPRSPYNNGVITKRYGFFPLESFAQAQGWHSTIRETLRDVAIYLAREVLPIYEENLNRKRRAEIKVIEMAMPHLLAQEEVAGLVAVVPPNDRDQLIAFAEGKSSSKGDWLYINDGLDALCSKLNKIGSDHWIVGLHGLGCCSPMLDNVQNPNLIELRFLLRLASTPQDTQSPETVLQETRRYLAELCAKRAVKLDTEKLDQAQWAWAARYLMAEHYLASQDTTDLVALVMPELPELSPETAKRESHVRVYRSLDPFPEATKPISNDHVVSLAKWKGMQKYEFGPTFSLLPGDGDLQRSLGAVLWATHSDRQLAETLIMLAMNDREEELALKAEVRIELGRQALWLMGVANPWNWQHGKYDDWLRLCYRVLDEAFEEIVGKTADREKYYYQGLRGWYSCYVKSAAGVSIDDILRTVSLELHSSLPSVTESPQPAATNGKRAAEGRTTDIHEQVRELLDFVDSALFAMASGDPPKLPARSDLRWMRWSAAEQLPANSLLSPLCQSAWHDWFLLRRDHRKVLLHTDTDVLMSALRMIQGGNNELRRQALALPHELAVLNWMFDKEEKDLERDIREQQTSLRISCSLLGIQPWRWVEVSFDVINMGEQTIQEGLELRLNDSPDLLLRSQNPVSRLPKLLPRATEKCTYEVLVEPRVTASGRTQSEVVFTFSYDLEHNREQRVAVPIQEPDFVLKKREFNTGRPIEDPDRFFGREDEINKMTSVLASNSTTSFILSGPRRMGKTSILNMLVELLGENSKDPDTRNKQLNWRHELFHLPAHWDGELDRYRTVKISLQGISWGQGHDPMLEFFRNLLKKVAEAVDPKLARRLLSAFEREWRISSVAISIQKQLKYILDKHPEFRLLVLLDEFDETYQQAGRDLAIALRDVISNEQRINWIITSTLLVYKESQRYGSPWFNILEPVQLGRFERKSAQLLVERTQPDEDFVYWEPNAIQEVLDVTGCHPYFLQVFCGRIIDYINDNHQNGVTSEMVLLVETKASEADEDGPNQLQFGFFWGGEKGDAPAATQLILLSVLDADELLTRHEVYERMEKLLHVEIGSRVDTLVPIVRKTGGEADLLSGYELTAISWWHRAIDRSFEWVTRVVGALYHDRDSGTLKFTMPLFRRWLKNKGRYEDLQNAALARVRQELDSDLSRRDTEQQELNKEFEQASKIVDKQ